MVHSSRKRKAAGLEPLSSESSKRRKNSSVNGARTVRLHELNWKPVEVPDTLDDYGGFFGLEEVDGVEVVKDHDTGRVAFKTSDTKLDEEEWEDGAENGDMIEGEGVKHEGQEELDKDEEEWDGFSDEHELEEAQEKVEVVKSLKSACGTTRGDSKSKRNNARIEQDEELEDMPFSELAELQGSDDDGSEEGVDISAWSTLKLSPETLISLSRLKFSSPTLIQSKAIPEILSGEDVIGKAATGSGKTLAYGIPILEHYLQSGGNLKSRKELKPNDYIPQALIISPTRELAHQIASHLTPLGRGVSSNWPRISIVTGGLSIQKQQRQLQTADIIVGTPGRIWDVLSIGGQPLLSKLQHIKFLIIDEADRLLSEGHFAEVSEILNALERVDWEDENAVKEMQKLKAQRQVLVFSATFDRSLRQKLAAPSKKPKHHSKATSTADLTSAYESLSYLLTKIPFRTTTPHFIDVSPTTHLAPTIHPTLLTIPIPTEKDLYLYTLLLLHPRTRTLIFTNSISATRHLTSLLRMLSFPTQALHSSMPQKSRLRTLERFAGSRDGILIATDVAARGLDITGVELVVHYHVPRSADAYVHRSGRTARAGRSGFSVVLCSATEARRVAGIVDAVHVPVEGSRLRALDLDARVLPRVRERVRLAARIVDVEAAKEKMGGKGWDLFAQAAEDLGVEGDLEAWEELERGRRGRGNARRKREKENKEVAKEQVEAWKAELKGMLGRRVNVGVSERYLTSGGVDVDALLRGETGEFLGRVREVGLVDSEH
jgi:ATP-dependent RNA helicase DDX24/MAK5